jgi:hypothetical protein
MPTALLLLTTVLRTWRPRRSRASGLPPNLASDFGERGIDAVAG